MTTQYETAVKLVRERRDISTEALKRLLSAEEKRVNGNLYGVAALFIERMVREKIISEPNAQGKRKVLNPIKKPKAKYTDAQLLSSG